MASFFLVVLKIHGWELNDVIQIAKVCYIQSISKLHKPRATLKKLHRCAVWILRSRVRLHSDFYFAPKPHQGITDVILNNSSKTLHRQMPTAAEPRYTLSVAVTFF